MEDIRSRGARVIIGDFYAISARHIICEAYHLDMTQEYGYVWFLPGWFDDEWYDIDKLRNKSRDKERQEMNQGDNSTGEGDKPAPEAPSLPDCTTDQMVGSTFHF